MLNCRIAPEKSDYFLSQFIDGADITWIANVEGGVAVKIGQLYVADEIRNVVDANKCPLLVTGMKNGKRLFGQSLLDKCWNDKSAKSALSCTDHIEWSD